MKFEEMTPAMQKRLVALAEGSPRSPAGEAELVTAGLERRDSAALTEAGIRCYKTRGLHSRTEPEEETSLVRFQPRAYTIMGFALILATILGVLL